MFGYAPIGSKNAMGDAMRRYADRRADPNSGLVAIGAHFRGSAQQSVQHAHIAVLLDGWPAWDRAGSPAATAHEIAAAYLERDKELLAELNGGFALAIFDDRTNELLIAVDRMGIGKLAWAADDDFFAFSSSAAALARRPGTTMQLRPQALYDYFFFHMVPGPQSVYAGVHKLPAASALRLTGNACREFTYWTPDFSRRLSPSFRDLQLRVTEALEGAVRARYCGPQTGAFLSGGLDSSTVTGYLSKVTGGQAKTFSIGFEAEGFDEIEYARITNRHFACIAHEYYVKPDDVLTAIPIVAKSYDEPFGNSSAIPTYFCAKFARENGVTRLLAGDGGDELFGGNARYGRHKVFEIFNSLPAPLRAVLAKVTQSTIGTASRITPLRKLRSYVDQALIPLPERFESWNFVYREGATTMFSETLLNQIDPNGPIRQMVEVFRGAPAHDLLDRMLYYDWKFTLADNDLRKVGAMCAAAGIQVDYPMLDNRVVDLSIQVPSNLKMRGFELRTFYKRAMRGFLPDAVLAKPKHGFGLPFGAWLKSHAKLADFVYESLRSLMLRDVVKPEFAQRMMDEHRSGDSGYYGSLIWDLVILEEWLKQQSAADDRIEHTTSQSA